jgi:hypothetical protein
MFILAMAASVQGSGARRRTEDGGLPVAGVAAYTWFIAIRAYGTMLTTGA